PPGFPQGFTCPAVLRYRLRVGCVFAYAAVTLFGSAFQRASANAPIDDSTVAALQPPGAAGADQDLGCADFARHYFRHRGFFLLLRVLRWFTSPGSLRSAYAFS